MKKQEVSGVINDLIREIEEEDVGISLLTTFYQVEDELAFFPPDKRERVQEILKRLGEDSKRHKAIVAKVIQRLEKEKRTREK